MDTKTNSLETIDRDLGETKILLVNNANKLIERTNYLNNIEDTTETLKMNSSLFKKHTHSSWKMWFQKYYCCFVGIIISLLFGILFMIIYFSNSKS